VNFRTPAPWGFWERAKSEKKNAQFKKENVLFETTSIRKTKCMVM
jgi:hypothetical protein